MNCPKCGVPLPDNSKFCLNCGYKISQNISDNNTDSSKEQKINLNEISQNEQNTYFYSSETPKEPNYSNQEIKSKTSSEKNRFGNIATAIIIGVIILFLIWMFHACTTSSTGHTTTTAETSAYLTAEDAVKSQLKAPSTASFPWYNDSFVTDNGDGTYTVSAYVDAENSFGAKIRSNWSCKVSGDNVSDIVIS
jgi:hypothetical protein